MSIKLLYVVIVGGGMVGWMIVNLLVKCWLSQLVIIILVELLDIGIIGVGEGFIFILKCFFSDMGIVEQDWMFVCNVIYKVSICFEGWSLGVNIFVYFYLFISQFDIFSECFFYVNCFYWCLGQDVIICFEDLLFNGWLVKYQFSLVILLNFFFCIEYGYYFDLGFVGEFLKCYVQGLGVMYKVLNIIDVECYFNGDIVVLYSKEGECVEGDFFIDCIGFQLLLL